MIKRKDGFKGERSVLLPRMIVELEKNDPLARSLFVTDIGYYPKAANHYRERQEGADQYILIYCVDGSGWYRIGGDPLQRVSRGQYFILPASQPHAYGSDSGEGWTIYWVHFSGEQAAVYAADAQQPQTIRVAQDSRILSRIDIFEELFLTLHSANTIDSLRYASSLLHYFLASMRYVPQYRFSGNSRATIGQGGQCLGETFDVVGAAVHFMKENMERRITLHEVLAYVGYSQTYLSSLFRQRLGMSIKAFFNHLKIEYSCRMLQTTDMHINQICYKLGIEDSSYFSRLFTKTVGMSPTAYRIALRGGAGCSSDAGVHQMSSVSSGLSKTSLAQNSR